MDLKINILRLLNIRRESSIERLRTSPQSQFIFQPDQCALEHAGG